MHVESGPSATCRAVSGLDQSPESNRETCIMATQPADNPGDTPDETPVLPTDPGVPAPPTEVPETGPDFDQPERGPVELPPPD